jgi:hypothetical protein
VDSIKVQYVAVWRLSGANKLASPASSVELARLTNPTLVATVTVEPEPLLLHIDRSEAVSTQLLKGLFARDKDGTPQERLAAELENVKARRSQETDKGVFLILEGETEIPAPDFKTRRDTDEFAVCIDAIEKPAIREAFQPVVQKVLTALGLSLPANADRQVTKVGEVIYLVDPDTGKPIYTFSFQAGLARASVASPLTEEFVEDAGKRLQKVIVDKTFERPSSLLITSLNRATDPLQAFIAAWSALEIFVNASFKATYQSRWFQIIENGAPTAAKPVFERFKDVMSDKYRLVDKFLIIASVLDADGATTDADEFRKLKGIRDNLLHALETPPYLPTEAVQKLLLKYMTLHLDLEG